MPPGSVNNLTITNPLVLYRALISARRIEPDPAQHRLALHLQKLYHRLKDYSPEIDFEHRLKVLRDLINGPNFTAGFQREKLPYSFAAPEGRSRSWSSKNADTTVTALVRQLTDQEAAVEVDSPQGLLVCGEVGTGKSLLIDLFAESLPTANKRRWHFNTFMLEMFSKLENLRRTQSSAAAEGYSLPEEYNLLRMARNLISTSPIIFIDEFQFPDRASSKLLSNLLTSFFHLGGVLIATSNRVPEELVRSAGVEHGSYSTDTAGNWRGLFGLFRYGSKRGEGLRLQGSQLGEYASFSQVLKARCEVWEMEGNRDWRRRDESTTIPSFNDLPKKSSNESEKLPSASEAFSRLTEGRDPKGSMSSTDSQWQKSSHSGASEPEFFQTRPLGVDMSVYNHQWLEKEAIATGSGRVAAEAVVEPSWTQSEVFVYGRQVKVPRQLNGVTKWRFQELCMTNLGPADYTSLASTFHTFIVTEIPILTLVQKNEARRFITLLDALYEARCKLLIHAESGPDDLFFPETRRGHGSGSERDRRRTVPELAESVYAETFSDIYQDQTSPFRPNVSSYAPSASTPTYVGTSTSVASQLARKRSILADEDSDFGPIQVVSRGGNDSSSEPNFSQIGTFTGEDEMFAYKRARSRLWEMCSSRWWGRQGDWWRPLPVEVRHWEKSRENTLSSSAPASKTSNNDETVESLFPHGASPFRASQEPPPKFNWTHAWGMMIWGKKAGIWGKGPAGLSERKLDSQTAENKDPKGHRR